LHHLCHRENVCEKKSKRESKESEKGLPVVVELLDLDVDLLELLDPFVKIQKRVSEREKKKKEKLRKVFQ
jgi:hypothetical protein